MATTIQGYATDLLEGRLAGIQDATTLIEVLAEHIADEFPTATMAEWLAIRGLPVPYRRRNRAKAIAARVLRGRQRV